jgi:hypothetical protein
MRIVEFREMKRSLAELAMLFLRMLQPLQQTIARRECQYAIHRHRSEWARLRGEKNGIPVLVNEFNGAATLAGMKQRFLPRSFGTTYTTMIRFTIAVQTGQGCVIGRIVHDVYLRTRS